MLWNILRQLVKFRIPFSSTNQIIRYKSFSTWPTIKVICRRENVHFVLIVLIFVTVMGWVLLFYLLTKVDTLCMQILNYSIKMQDWNAKLIKVKVHTNLPQVEGEGLNLMACYNLWWLFCQYKICRILITFENERWLRWDRLSLKKVLVSCKTKGFLFGSIPTMTWLVRCS